MQTFDSITAARTAIMDFRADHFNDLPDSMKDRFKELAASPSAPEQMVGLGEFLFANRELIDDDAKGLAVSLIAFCNEHGWHGLLEDQRGDKIVTNLRKELGEIKTAPAAPEPRPGMAISEAPAEGPAPVAPSTEPVSTE